MLFIPGLPYSILHSPGETEEMVEGDQLGEDVDMDSASDRISNESVDWERPLVEDVSFNHLIKLEFKSVDYLSRTLCYDFLQDIYSI